METIRALAKGETGKGRKTVAFLLSDGREEALFVLFTPSSELFVLFVGLMLGRCTGETVMVLLTVAK